MWKESRILLSSAFHLNDIHFERSKGSVTELGCSLDANKKTKQSHAIDESRARRLIGQVQ